MKYARAAGEASAPFAGAQALPFSKLIGTWVASTHTVSCKIASTCVERDLQLSSAIHCPAK
jgi:hypothetical protein